MSTRSHGLTFCSGIAGGGAGIAIALTEACPGATVWPSTCTQLHPSYCTTCKKCQGKKVISVFLWGLAVYEPKFIQVDATSEGDGSIIFNCKVTTYTIAKENGGRGGNGRHTLVIFKKGATAWSQNTLGCSKDVLFVLLILGQFSN